ncbi:ankyrin [Camillea tinctor]|nr:ankyrin [Camillea tinctor]
MAERTAEKILARRRVQNREAQRRFRALDFVEKKTLQKTLDLPHHSSHLYRTPDSLIQSLTPVDSSLSFPSSPHRERITANFTRSIRGWDLAASEPLVADDNSFFGHDNIPDDAASHLPVFPYQKISTATFSPADISPGLPILDSSVETSMDSLSSVAETSLSPEDAGIEPPDETLSSPTSKSSTKRSGGWSSPLHLAAKKGSNRIIRMLLQHNTDCNELDSEGLTPLIHAVIGGHEEATLSLLEFGARVENVRNGEGPRRSAIHWAVIHRREGMLRLLLDHCSDPKLINSCDHLGRAPLHIAIEIGFDSGVGLLLEFGADPSQKVQYY